MKLKKGNGWPFIKGIETRGPILYFYTITGKRRAFYYFIKMTERKCMTCGSRAITIVEFLCPECGAKLLRCSHCRSVNNPYKCKCGFTGP